MIRQAKSICVEAYKCLRWAFLPFDSRILCFQSPKGATQAFKACLAGACRFPRGYTLLFIPFYSTDYSGYHWAVYDNNNKFYSFDDSDATSGEDSPFNHSSILRNKLTNPCPIIEVVGWTPIRYLIGMGGGIGTDNSLSAIPLPSRGSCSLHHLLARKILQGTYP